MSAPEPPRGEEHHASDTFQSDELSVTAGYACPCGCAPSVTYERRSERARDLCCCGNEFVVGPEAERSLRPLEGFVLETEQRTSGWGEPVTAAWLVGPSVHPEPLGASDIHHHGHAQDRRDGTPVDPIWGMRVEPATAIKKGLHDRHDGVDIYFCGKGCYLDFGDDPEHYLDPS